jgi:imidazolonepropionase-like amidohydrolase
VLPAEHFGLTDRGVIAPGRRADLVLVDGDPLHDIRAVRSISRVWCGGIEQTPAHLAKRS